MLRKIAYTFISAVVPKLITKGFEKLEEKKKKPKKRYDTNRLTDDQIKVVKNMFAAKDMRNRFLERSEQVTEKELTAKINTLFGFNKSNYKKYLKIPSKLPVQGETE